MIIDEKVKSLEMVGEDSSKRATISQNKLAKLQYLLTKGLYKDPITAVIAEWTNNGVDSVVQAGKDPVENPVMVKICVGDKGQTLFSVEDKGTGLDDQDFENICMSYLESTKESDNDTIGHFGIGMKSFLALERSATFTCRKNGVERKYLVYEGEEFVNFNLIYTKDTPEENGVLAELVINNWQEANEFTRKTEAKLAYYDTAVLIVKDKVVENTIHRNELFQWSTANKDTYMHLCLKDVYYPIDWAALGIPSIGMSIAIRMKLGDGLTPTPSRESYITNEKAKKLILSKIEEIATWFVSKYNETVKEFPTFIDSYRYLSTVYYNVELPGVKYSINHLLAHTKLKVAPVRIKGLSIRDGEWYKSRQNYMFQNYNSVGYVTGSGTMRSKENNVGVSKDYHVLNGHKTVEVGHNFRGNIKDYLKSKYGGNTLFVRKNGGKWYLNRKKGGDLFGSLKDILALAHVHKKEWRKYIEEWNFVVSSITSTFENEIDVENSQGFKDWIEAKKERMRLQRLAGYVGTSNRMNKTLGDVTLAYSYDGLRGVAFKKAVYQISKLTETKFLTVMFTEDDVDSVKKIIYAMRPQKTVRFALVGKNEIKKVPKHYKFINYKEFMTRDCKPFMRLASAIRFKEMLDTARALENSSNAIIRVSTRGLSDDLQKLKDYCAKNLEFTDEEKSAITDVADKYDLYDKSLWDVYTRVKDAIGKYEFIAFMRAPAHYDTDLQEKYNKFINQMLLFRKKYYGDLPEGAEIIIKMK